MLSRSSICKKTSGMVCHSPRRLDPIRGKSAKKIPGYLSARFRKFRLEKPLAGDEIDFRILDRLRNLGFQSRQSSHKTAPVLALADPGTEKNPSRNHSSFRRDRKSVE